MLPVDRNSYCDDYTVMIFMNMMIMIDIMMMIIFMNMVIVMMIKIMMILTIEMRMTKMDCLAFARNLLSLPFAT